MQNPGPVDCAAEPSLPVLDLSESQTPTVILSDACRDSRAQPIMLAAFPAWHGGCNTLG
jgi:hypothetical protein